MSGDTFTTRARYEWEGDSYYDALVYAYLDGVGNWHHLYDGLGTTRQLLDDNQAVTDTYQCEAFGNSMGATGSTAASSVFTSTSRPTPRACRH